MRQLIGTGLSGKAAHIGCDAGSREPLVRLPGSSGYVRSGRNRLADFLNMAVVGAAAAANDRQIG
ncbi:MAG: hypothetical protein ACR2OM_01260, partial [Aestuariivirgaceae bacterium]